MTKEKFERMMGRLLGFPVLARTSTYERGRRTTVCVYLPVPDCGHAATGWRLQDELTSVLRADNATVAKAYDAAWRRIADAAAALAIEASRRAA